MLPTKHILAINGSASAASSNERLLRYVAAGMSADVRFTYAEPLATLPHFDPERTVADPPAAVVAVRAQVAAADAVLFCTPEYVFSIPSALKCLVEWCVATTVFTDKPVGIITASADGRKGHEELQLLLRTLGARFTDDTCLLVQGIKSKIDMQGNITDAGTVAAVAAFTDAFRALIKG